MSSVNHDLVGLFFRTFDDEGNQDFHGQILGRPEPGHYLCQLFNWYDEPSCAKIVHISEMARWAFYSTEDAWLNAAANKKDHARALADPRRARPINDVFSRRPEAGR